MVVVTVQHTGDLSPREFATELFNLWGVGKKGKDNGVLILAVMERRRIEVEVGYGLEEVLTDARIGRLLDQELIPFFRQGEFGKGLLAGVQGIATLIGAGEAARQPLPPIPTEPLPEPKTFLPLATFLFGLLMGLLAVTGLGALGWWFWRNWRRYCPECRKPMRLLSESEDDAYLTFERQFEESIGSVNYRVWRCDDCQTLDFGRIVNIFRDYQKCPQCDNRTLTVTTYRIVEPTYETTGLEEIHKICRYPRCHYSETRTRRIPRRSRQVWIGTGGSGRGGGFFSGSSGGGFGGGG
ncbi:MAG: TPM domain-containing protein, partial [Armatimonadetes bacterium]|nr:TPM domain-containing protein [Armatimonadota bacterium]